MSELVGHACSLGWVALKAVLLFALALAAFRVGERRTVAQLSPFDFVVAVALGAIIAAPPRQVAPRSLPARSPCSPSCSHTESSPPCAATRP